MQQMDSCVCAFQCERIGSPWQGLKLGSWSSHDISAFIDLGLPPLAEVGCRGGAAIRVPKAAAAALHQPHPCHAAKGAVAGHWQRISSGYVHDQLVLPAEVGRGRGAAVRVSKAAVAALHQPHLRHAAIPVAAHQQGRGRRRAAAEAH